MMYSVYISPTMRNHVYVRPAEKGYCYAKRFADGCVKRLSAIYPTAEEAQERLDKYADLHSWRWCGCLIDPENPQMHLKETVK